MGMLTALRRIDRKVWFVCYGCLQHTAHDALKSIFYHDGPPTLLLGRPLTPCPRCKSTNTVSFQKLKEDGSEAQLWGLEQIVKQHPRSFFEATADSEKIAS
ncbi:MAG: hypothetical protein ACE145_11735 [Terriglobia bacterium]